MRWGRGKPSDGEVVVLGLGINEERWESSTSLDL
jgi:hypothetical protein